MNDDFFWLVNNRIIIPEVKSEHRFIHITDLHIHAWDELSTDEEKELAIKKENDWMSGKENFAKSSGEPFGESQKISSIEAFEKILLLAGELSPEAILLTGDNLDYMHPAGKRYLKNRVEDYEKNGGKIICVPGNHESADLDGIWSSKLRVYDFKDFRIAAIDDSKKTVDEDTLIKLETLCNEGIPIIIICHIPLSTELCKGKLEYAGPYFYIDENTDDENGRKFISLIKNSKAIRAVICGHLHRYIKCELSDGKAQIIGSQGMAGAVDLITVCGE